MYAPASIANLGPGFDVFGLALDGLGDILRLSLTPEKAVSISVRGVEADSIPEDALANSAGSVAQHALRLHDFDYGFHVEIEKGVPPGKGLGSSGASAAATAYAADRLLGLGLSRRELVRLAAVGEAAVSGSPHADNVSASLLGGFTMVGPDYEVIRLDPPEMRIAVVIPDVRYEDKTRRARKLLPESVKLREAVFNIGCASRMAVASALGDGVLFGRSICDSLVEPHRAVMIPNFWDVKKAALDAGAYGCSIAGGGPSVFAVGEDIVEIGRRMAEAFEDAGVESDTYFTRPSSMGARVV